MKILDPGHKYDLDDAVDDITDCYPDKNVVVFIKRVDGKLIENGTTNEEVLAMLIDRMSWLQEKLPCRENAIVITKLEESLMWLNERTKKRIIQRVETKDIAHK